MYPLETGRESVNWNELVLKTIQWWGLYEHGDKPSRTKEAYFLE
jgi:hypothetical protein